MYSSLLEIFYLIFEISSSISPSLCIVRDSHDLITNNQYFYEHLRRSSLNLMLQWILMTYTYNV